MQCVVCGSYAINHHLHGRDGSDGDKCDVCYWHSRAERYAEEYSAAAAQIKELLQVIEDLERGSEMLSQRVQELGETARENRSRRIVELEGRIAELEAQLSAIGAGGVEPLRKTSADTSALRAALEEAEAALEVATSRLSARGPDYPVYVTSEACALESVRKALGKSHADHFRDATKMMLPTAPDPQGLDAQVQDRLDRLYLALEVCSAELFAQCADQGRAMKYVEQARSALAAEQCARAAQAVCGGAAS